MRICSECSHENPTHSPVCNACGSPLANSLPETQPIPSPALAVEGRFTPGTVFARRYRIVAPVGRGGMGEVYRANDLTLGQSVALKFLPESLSDDSRALNRLYNEVRLARQISHPNVCRVYDIAEAEGLHFLTMEFVEGEDLGSLLRRIGRLSPAKATEIAAKLCAGLYAAHERGVLHRDIKPSNVMLDAQGKVRITDFGIAVASRAIEPNDIASGTPPYMAPEQLAGEQVTVRSDLYSLGLVLYELFGGRHPFEDTPRRELLQRKRQTNPAALSPISGVDPHIEQAILHCLEPDPRRRPPSAAAVSAELAGGDPLAIAIAAGDTPAPELVARAGATEGMPVVYAVGCIGALFVSLTAFALAAPRTSILSRVPMENAGALERVARDKLASLGIPERPAHVATGYGYAIDALRRRFDAGALYFWYRASPEVMLSKELTGLITLDDPPTDRPGMITAKLDGSGRLLYLQAVPIDRAVSMPAGPDLWNTLFTAAGLRMDDFQPAQTRWVPAPGWDLRASWTGTYPDAVRTPVRIEAAAWSGMCVYFEVIPLWISDSVARKINAEYIGGRQLALYMVVLATSAVLSLSNIRRGRGDRRGAFRVAAVVFLGTLASWSCKATHVGDVREFIQLFRALLLAGFFAANVWTMYTGLEPYVRRRWPHALISWNRLLSGRAGDPVVASHVLVGITTGASIVAVTMVGLAVAGAYGLRMPSVWMLHGPSGALGEVLSDLPEAITRGLFILFVTAFFKVVFRREWLAVIGVIAATIVFEVPGSPLPPVVTTVVVVAWILTLTYVLLRSELLAAIVALYTILVLSELPITSDLSAPATGGAIVMLVCIAFVALLSFRFTLRGRPLFRLEM